MRISDWSSDVCSSDLRQYLRRRGHEAHAAEGYDVSIGRLRLAAQIEAVADEIGEVLDFRLLVIMREDDGVALLAQPVDLRPEVQALQAWIGCVHALPVRWERLSAPPAFRLAHPRPDAICPSEMDHGFPPRRQTASLPDR